MIYPTDQCTAEVNSVTSLKIHAMYMLDKTTVNDLWNILVTDALELDLILMTFTFFSKEKNTTQCIWKSKDSSQETNHSPPIMAKINVNVTLLFPQSCKTWEAITTNTLNLSHLRWWSLLLKQGYDITETASRQAYRLQTTVN